MTTMTPTLATIMPTTITAHEATGGPPIGLGTFSVLRWAVKHPPEDPRVSFAGKTVLVTGANTGLGFEAALKFARLGAKHLILGVRSLERGGEAKMRIMSICTERAGEGNFISVMAVDHSSFASVQAFAQSLPAQFPHLDVALLNAGMLSTTFEKNAAGWEQSLQVNVLSTALLAILLLPLLQKAPAGPSHLTFVSSNTHASVSEVLAVDGGENFSLLAHANDSEKFAVDSHYGVCKLLGLATAMGVARAAATAGGPRVIVNAMCPGHCRTELARTLNPVARLLLAAGDTLMSRTAEQGARSLVSATALGPESHGRFWSHDVLYPVGGLAKDDAFMKRTWDEILEVLSLVQVDITQILNSV